jgi:hypothetical protein
MMFSSQAGSQLAPQQPESAPLVKTSEDRAYRALTVVAILTFLASLWIF